MFFVLPLGTRGVVPGGWAAWHAASFVVALTGGCSGVLGPAGVCLFFLVKDENFILVYVGQCLSWRSASSGVAMVVLDSQDTPPKYFFSEQVCL